MSATNSTQTYVKEVVGDLQVVDRYKELMKASVDEDSLYIRAKETLLEYFAEPGNTLSEREKAGMLVDLISNMSVQISNTAMNTAVAIADKNRTGAYEITKMREDILLTKEQRDKLAADNLLVGANVDKVTADKDNSVIQGWKLQASMIREDGLLKDSMPSITSAVLPATSIGNQGLKWEQEQQTKMSVYATLAKSYRESGVITWTVDAEGKINAITDANSAAPGLTKAQENVAIRQEVAFDDNKRQHAANSSANMIGLLLSAEESGNITSEDVTKWRNAVDYLNTTTP